MGGQPLQKQVLAPVSLA